MYIYSRKFGKHREAQSTQEAQFISRDPSDGTVPPGWPAGLAVPLSPSHPFLLPRGAEGTAAKPPWAVSVPFTALEGTVSFSHETVNTQICFRFRETPSLSPKPFCYMRVLEKTVPASAVSCTEMGEAHPSSPNTETYLKKNKLNCYETFLNPI